MHAGGARVVRDEAFLSHGLAHLPVGSLSCETKILQILASMSYGFLIGEDPKNLGFCIGNI